MGDNLDIEKTFNHWIDISDKDFDTMIHLYNSKDYHWSLFIGHIVIERLLKAGVIKQTLNHNYKEAFYRKCTYEFTTDWIEKIKILRKWIKEKLLS